VGQVLEEVERELEAFARECAGQPREEMRRLFLLALEREQIVSVGYREGLIAQRLLALPIDPEAREVMRHALLWAWKDEEMHAVLHPPVPSFSSWMAPSTGWPGTAQTTWRRGSRRSSRFPPEAAAPYPRVAIMGERDFEPHRRKAPPMALGMTGRH
jgi:hypothetical protein